MTAPFDVGSRVVCPDPTGRRFVGVVTHVHACSDLRVSYGDGAFRASAGEVRPVMPRDRRDLDKYGRWWWRAAIGPWLEQPVQVCANVRNDGHVFRIAWYNASFDDWSTPTDDGYWRGPVQPPPVVRV